MCFPVLENGIGARNLDAVVRAFAYKLWWKWCTSTGLWANYLRSVTLSKSVQCQRLMAVDDVMRAHVRVIVHSGICSFLFDNWSGSGSLKALFDLEIDESLRTIHLRDVFVDGC